MEQIDCADFKRCICILHTNHFFHSFNFSFKLMVPRKTRRIRSTNNFFAQLLPPSVELVETTLFNLIDQGFGAGILGLCFCFLQQEMHIHSSKRFDRLGKMKLSKVNAA